jgi:hypothetical protein
MIPLLVLPIAKQGIRHPIISSMTLVSWNPSSSPLRSESDLIVRAREMTRRANCGPHNETRSCFCMLNERWAASTKI